MINDGKVGFVEMNEFINERLAKGRAELSVLLRRLVYIVGLKEKKRVKGEPRGETKSHKVLIDYKCIPNSYERFHKYAKPCEIHLKTQKK